MNTLIFELDQGNKSKALRESTRLFKRAGAQVVSAEVDAKLSRRAGVTFRNINFSFADNQTVTFAVKTTGDVFEVRLNGKAIPLRHQDDHALAIGEIAERMDAGRAAYQRALAKVRVPLPPSIRVARVNMITALTERRDNLVAAVSEAKATYEKLTGVPAAA
jgi:hypothetical protein